MSDIKSDLIVENYKGLLQEYCHVRNLGDPSYEVTQFGSPNEPSWEVEVRYGGARHSTPEPLSGSKRFAEQMAAKQVLEILKSRQQAFLAGESVDMNTSNLEEFESEVYSDPAKGADLPPIDAPVELLASALTAASQRIAGASRRGVKYRESSDSKRDNEIYARNVAELTVQIVRELIAAAESNNVKIT
ncbi:MAG: putative dsRNA-binding protein [Candidatus Poribacteria bacterium]|nr:putative dsRNA-binding protein [Candidatus Poribacteria bacterium]